MPSRSLPSRPSIQQLKIQATELRRAHAEGKRSAAARIAAHHPKLKGRTPKDVLAQRFSVADSQLVLAREYGYGSWAQLKQFVEISKTLAAFKPHPRFGDAVAAIDHGDAEALTRLLKADPELVHARTNLEPPYHYFTAATLLHHVAGNPSRGRLEGKLPPLPQNIGDITRVLLKAGAAVDSRTLGPNGGTTLGLVITSKQASDANVAGQLIDALVEFGGKLDVKTPGVLDGPLANHAPRAADKMIELGAKADLLAAAALGRMELLRDCFDDEGHLRARPQRGGKPMNERDAIGLALLFAYVNRRTAAVDFLLEKGGNWNMTGVNNGVALHRAAIEGDLKMVQRLVKKGADVGNRDNPFHASALSWADHGGQAETVKWLREHAKIDLHDAVCFDLPEHVAARLRENPSAVNARLDQWDVAQATPLHMAAYRNREAFAELLIENGAEVNTLAGNGQTALDIAREKKAEAVAKVLEQHGGKGAGEL